jgi:hypothetical protein
MHRSTSLTILFVSFLLSVASSCQQTSTVAPNSSPANKSAEAKQPANDRNNVEGAGEKEKKPKESAQKSVAKESAELERRVQANSAIAAIVKRNDAVVQWERELDETGGIYTMHLQSVLIRSDKRPILFFGFINDIVKRGDKFLADFDVFPHAYLNEGRFTIECTSNQVNQITSQGASPYDEYAVVALVSSVSRPKYKVRAKPLSENEAEIELDSPDTFLASGRCLALVHVGAKGQ